MKTNTCQPKKLQFLILISAVLLFIAGNANAQHKESKEKAGKQKYSIHIVKDVNDERTEIDTTFETDHEFDVQSWIDTHDLKKDMDDMDKKLKKMDKELTVTIPDFSSDDMKSMPDTIIVNGDTVIVNTIIKKMLKENPELGELGMEDYFDKNIDNPHFPKHGNMPEGCPFPDCPGMERMMPFKDFNFPGLEKLMPFGNLDRIVIKKKRHGKKVIISFEDNDDDIIIRKGNRHEYYFNDNEMQQHPERKRQIIIEKKGSPDIEEDEGTQVEKYNEGGKEVIIIRKKEKK